MLLLPLIDWGLRDYGADGQLGLEPTPEEYVANMVEVFRGVKRVLRDDGTVWLNLGDSYIANKTGSQPDVPSKMTGGRDTQKAAASRPDKKADGMKPKDLAGIPWLVAFALRQPYIVPTCVKSEIDRAWLAAIYDGEGTIGIRRFDSYRKEKQQVYQDGFVVYTVVTNSDIELLERCVAITGMDCISIKQKAGYVDGRGINNTRDSYGWRPEGNNGVDVIRAIYPYLVIKKKQAILAYTLDDINKNKRRVDGKVPKEDQDKKALLYDLIKKCNQRETIDMPSWVKEPKQEVEPGWYLRSDIIWHKPNPMPESVTDRPTKSHEYIFLLSKSQKYFYDAEAIKEKANYPGQGGAAIGHVTHDQPGSRRLSAEENMKMRGDTRNKRSVWTVSTQPYPGAHFATFPPKLIEPCILAGTSPKACELCGSPWVRVVDYKPNYEKRQDRGQPGWKGPQVDSSGWKPADIKFKGWQPSCTCDNNGTGRCKVLDIFAGSGTTLWVAEQNGRDSVGIELNSEYIELIKQRMDNMQVNIFMGG